MMRGSGLEREVGEMLRARGLSLALAESCTGGLVADRVTDVPGSSDYFAGGVVAYSNAAKERILGVAHETLAVHGAVSEPAAREMARGARRVFGAGVAVAVTGIAGPAGGTAEKPVGLTFIALSAPDAEWCERHVWAGDRQANKRQTAEAALRMLYRYLFGEAPPPAPPEWGGAWAGEEGFEPAAVEATLDSEGRATPRAFTWRGQVLAVRDVGRRWTEATAGGSSACVLVMTPDQSVFELRFFAQDGRWTARRVSGGGMVV